MKHFHCLLMIVALAVSALAQVPDLPMRGDVKVRLDVASSVIWQQIAADATIESLHADGLFSAVGLADDGSLVASFYVNSRTGGEVPQGPIADEPVPLLRTSWCDKDGVTHEVVTPIVSSTDGGVDRAVGLHEKLVARLQAKHPPRPCPPPAGP